LWKEFSELPTKTTELCLICSTQQWPYVFQKNTLLPRLAHLVSQQSQKTEYQCAIHERHEPDQYFHVPFRRGCDDYSLPETLIITASVDILIGFIST
jgi:hypothetical protein